MSAVDLANPNTSKDMGYKLVSYPSITMPPTADLEDNTVLSLPIDHVTPIVLDIAASDGLSCALMHFSSSGSAHNPPWLSSIVLDGQEVVTSGGRILLQDVSGGDLFYTSGLNMLINRPFKTARLVLSATHAADIRLAWADVEV